MPARKRHRKQNMEKEQYRTYGNVAYDLQQPVYSPDREQERELDRRRRARVRAAKAEEKYRFAVSVKTFATLFVLFAGCIAFMGMNVTVHNAEVSLRKQKSELENLKSANAIMEAELVEQLDMDYIRQEATERLGMSEPQSYQVVHIDVPKQGYTVQHAADDAVEESSWMTKLGELLKKD